MFKGESAESFRELKAIVKGREFLDTYKKYSSKIPKSFKLGVLRLDGELSMPQFKKYK